MSNASRHAYSEKYPPRNRVETGLGTIEIEVEGRDGKCRFDPNSAAIAAQSGTLARKLGQPVTNSVISGEPAYVYRNDAVEIPLTAEEIARLFAHSLEPEEFLALARTYGLFYEISRKFYDEDTGIAMEPNYSRAQREARSKVEHLPHILVVLEASRQKWHPHSIMRLHASQSIWSALASAGYNFRLIVLEPAEGREPVKVGLVGNTVAVHTLKDGSLRAYGPYDDYTDTEFAGYPELVAVSVCDVPSTIC